MKNNFRRKSNLSKKNEVKSGPRRPSFKNKSFQRISYYFSKKDFKCQSGLTEKLKISAGLVGCLEYLQAKIKGKVKVVKGYECVESAEKNKRLKRNYHSQGLAVNIAVEGMTLTALFEVVEQIQEFTVIGINYDENYIHICCAKDKARELWVIKNSQEVTLTEALRVQYNIAPLGSLQDESRS